ncbi:hypothetical protein SLS58_005681 [Diplodia intermedia]|uniref:Ras modification protein ERF4 n=1 Tax=Diplodia intermedia TaxID=856260 RepID=A0ABR3TQB3_9PEZI
MPRTLATDALLPHPPQPAPNHARWSLAQRIFNFAPFRAPQPPLQASSAAPLQAARRGAPASRLLNPVNSSPRTPVSAPSTAYRNNSLPPGPNVPIAAELPPPPTAEEGRDVYPLLPLPESHRHSKAHSSLIVEADSARASVGLPSGRRSLLLERPKQDDVPPVSPVVTGKKAGKSPVFTMESPTAAKIAGLDQPPRDDRPVSIILNPDDPEAGHRLHHSASRATMPHDTFRSRQPSAVSFPEPSEAGDEDEYAWGPSHPCFPHLNPHVPITSPLYSTTRVIRIKRDWMIAGDLAPTFANLYPEVLDPLISEDQFREIIKKINTQLQMAFDPHTTRAWVDAVMGAATLWLWEDLGLTGVKKTLKELEEWMEEWNRTVGAKEGVKIIPLRRTGYLTLDIQIPDPHIGLEQSNASIRSRPITGAMDTSASGAPQLPQITA